MHTFPYIIELLPPKRSPAEKVDWLLDRFAARFRQIMDACCGVWFDFWHNMGIDSTSPA